MASPSSKLLSLPEAARAVPDGATITAGGFAHSHQPMAFVRELIRQRRTDLTLIGVAECWIAEFLAAAGMLRRAYLSNFMLEGYGRCQCFARGVESGAIAVEDHSHFGMLSRLTAAGLGLPFMPVRAMAGTDILAQPGFEAPEHKARQIASPFSDESVLVVSPLRPDFAILHVARADRLGNAQMFGTVSALAEQARAARHVILTADEIVDTEAIRRRPEATLIPGLMVDAVVHAPFGAHPTGVYGLYDHDPDHLGEYYRASRDAAAVAAYLARRVYGPGDEGAYLDALGASRLLALRVDPALGYRWKGQRHD